MINLVLDGESLDLDTVWAWAHDRRTKLSIAAKAMKRVRDSHAFVGRVV